LDEYSNNARLKNQHSMDKRQAAKKTILST